MVMPLPMDTAMDMATTDTPMPMDTTMARGLLMPSPLPMLMPTMVATLATLLLWPLPPLCPPSTEVPSTDSPTAVSTATTTARGLLMPSPLLPLLLKLMPMLTTTTGTPTTAIATAMLLPTMATASTDTPTCTTATTDTIIKLLVVC